MSTMLPVLHGAARAISPAEFLEALYAISPPRFPSARGVQRRSVCLAISGGVDSMALAYLCSRIRHTNAWLKLADHPIKHFRASIVDHRLRASSTAEARAVAKVLQTNLQMPADISTIRWDRELGPDTDTSPEALSRLPNIESLARRYRYRLLGRNALRFDMTSILLAHHEDDQYETVLMRLLSGHGTRGLRGIRPATDIPECGDLHGVYQSGFLDDLTRSSPMLIGGGVAGGGLTRRERKYLKHAMRHEIDPAVWEREMETGISGEDVENGRHPYLHGYTGAEPKRRRRTRATPPPLEPMDVEDGGVGIYRPLLGFSKERLVATCLHNDIPWFEDATNKDPTLTMRNAVRFLVANQNKLPVALRKPAVLRLAERCRARVADEDAEAARLLGRVGMHDFEPNVGSLVVQLPQMKMPGVPRRSSAVRRKRRRQHYARIAGILVQKLLALVTPEQQLTSLKDLGWVVGRLFPSLSGTVTGNKGGGGVQQPKAFTICGVHVIPLPGHRGQGLRWYLSRAPHASQLPRPVMRIYRPVYTRRWRTTPHKWPFSRWSNWGLFDNRFWVSLRCRFPFDVTVAPFEAEHAKAFREPMTPAGREELDAALRRYAPGKVRYTLPAIYVRGDIDALIAGEDDWRVHEVILQGRDMEGEEAEEERKRAARGSREPKPGRYKPPVLKRQALRREEMRGMLNDKVRLVALPTLGIGIPGIESWVEWRFRYRKVEMEMLAVAAAGEGYDWRQRVRRQVRGIRARMKMVRMKRQGQDRGRLHVRQPE